jgi:Nucleotidyl transferase AbiEii toxin, Type IV TA system
MTPSDIESEVFPYASAQAFGAAITGRLKNLAGITGRPVSQLRRQVAYDRLLARLFSANPREWILKGGVSMIARLSSARHTADVDLVAVADSADAALGALRTAAAHDLGDFFTFRFESPRGLVQGVPGLRIPTEARLGPRLANYFSLGAKSGAL